MMNQTNLPPLALYEQRLRILTEAANNPTLHEDFRDALRAAADLFSHKRGEAERAERQLHTRYYCGFCYGEIPQGEAVRIRGDSQRRRAHKVCEHIGAFRMPAARKQIAAGKFEHDPDKCYYHDKCPLRSEVPTMHPKRDVFEETF